MIEVKIKKDDDGHTYVIPAEMENKFRIMLESGEEDSYASFIEEFSKYMRNPADLKLYTDEI